MNRAEIKAISIDSIMRQEETAPVCTTCGTQYELTEKPEVCPVCLDERQYVPPDGQKWTSIQKLLKSDFSIETRFLENGLHGIAAYPGFSIGQRALIIETPEGNLMWDAIPLIDSKTIRIIQEMGGIDAIVPSHPHFYTSMVGWSRVLGDIPIYLPESAAKWVMRPNSNISFYRGDRLDLFGGISVHRTGGHFDCSQVAIWPAGAEGKGVLFSTDEPAVAPGSDRVSFMYSFPNAIPLDLHRIERIESILKPLSFDRIYSGWWGKVIRHNGKAIIERDLSRYADILRGKLNPAVAPPCPEKEK